MPRVARVTRSKVLDTSEHQVGQDGVSELKQKGDTVVLEKPEIDVVDGPRALAKAEELAFMEEPVTVTVGLTNDRNETQIVTIGVQGRNQNFIRGEPITVRRKFVEGLVRAKPTGYRNEEYVNSEGDKAFRYPSTTGLRYPFVVNRDDNPRGADWLRKILAEA